MLNQAIELPYQADSSKLFDRIADLPWAVFLDSSWPYSQQGRYDILAALPYLTLTTLGVQTLIETDTGKTVSQEDPFALLKQQFMLHNNTHAPSNLGLPFAGGAMGYLSYDLARRLEQLPDHCLDDLQLPEMAMGFYACAIVVDHQQKRTQLVKAKQDAKTEETCQLILKRLQHKPNIAMTPLKLLSPITANFDQASYAKAFAKIQSYLYNGDCYQVNLAQRFTAEMEGSAWQFYQTLRQHNPAAFAAYLNTPDANILSFSPERFLQVHDAHVETKPIKGTRPRGVDVAHDIQLATELFHSSKDRAENLMIVDLLRNDLSKNCQLNSVRVPSLFALESHPSVHHLVSTVTGKLAADKHCVDLLRGCFPGGSVTGAPKIRAMQIIEELEPHRRGVYCGAIGYIDFNGNMDMNIAIRTLLWKQQQVFCYAGGALTIDSDCAAEYAETFAKVRILLEALRCCVNVGGDVRNDEIPRCYYIRG